MIAGICFMSVATGLLTTLEVDTYTTKWIGYQILYGCGTGLASQAPNLAAQTVLSKQDIATGTSLMFFSQLLGGAIFVSVGQNVLNNELLKRFASVLGFRPESIQTGGAISLTNLPKSVRRTSLVAYNESLRQVFRVGLVLACVSILGALAMEWRTVKKDLVKQKDPEDDFMVKSEGFSIGNNVDAKKEKGTPV